MDRAIKVIDENKAAPVDVLAQGADALAAAIVAPPKRGRSAGPDELMILWGDLPRDAMATIFMPQVNADDIVMLANQDYGPRRIERLNAIAAIALLIRLTILETYHRAHRQRTTDI